MQGLSDKGQEETRVIAGVLRERLTLVADGSDFRVARILHSQYRHAEDGAELFREELSKAGVQVPLEPLAGLTPSSFMQPINREHRLVELCDDLLKKLAVRQASDGSAILLVGHGPQMDWIAGRMLRGRAWRSELALDRGELACLELHILTKPWDPLALHRTSRRSRLLWTLAPSDRDVEPALIDKIKSKMEAAKQLGGVIIAVLGVGLGLLADQEKLSRLIGRAVAPSDAQAQLPAEVPAGQLCKVLINRCQGLLPDVYHGMLVTAAGFMLLALAAFLASYFAYDGLLMPKRFWAESPGATRVRGMAARPPSSSARVLQMNMVRIWQNVFTPAVWLLVTAIALLACVVMHVDPLAFLVVAAVLVVLGRWYLSRFGTPVIGASD